MRSFKEIEKKVKNHMPLYFMFGVTVKEAIAMAIKDEVEQELNRISENPKEDA